MWKGVTDPDKKIRDSLLDNGDGMVEPAEQLWDDACPLSTGCADHTKLEHLMKLQWMVDSKVEQSEGGRCCTWQRRLASQVEVLEIGVS